VLVSAVSLWEIVVKVKVGKLDADIAEILEAVDHEGFEILDILAEHLVALAKLPLHHRDPFDHLLIAQAIADDLTLMSSDENVPLYPVKMVRC
jgi:PIN domain nuclease of toxin-antitoxin system